MRRASSYTAILRRALLGVAAVSSFAFMVSCGEDPTTPAPTPSPSPTPTPPPGKQVSEVVKWMDERLQKEYMWMDEYNNKHSSFDRTLEWDEYLGATLLSMTTNMDDGGGTGADRYDPAVTHKLVDNENDTYYFKRWVFGYTNIPDLSTVTYVDVEANVQ
jgi:hypothetical protein